MPIRNLPFALECKISKVMNKEHKFLPYRPGLKTGVGNHIVWYEIGSGFGEPGVPPPPQEFPKVPPRAFQDYSLFAVVAIQSQVYVQK